MGYGDLLNVLNRIAVALEQISERLPTQENNDKNYEFTNEDNLDQDSSGQLNNNYGILEDFLNQKGLKVNQILEKSAHDDIFNYISNIIGSNYKDLEPLLRKIKTSMAFGTRFSLSIKQERQQAIAKMCQLSSILYNNALLEEYNYKKSPVYLITAKPSTDGKFQNLINGNWLERYIAAEIENILQELFTEEESTFFSIFSNIQIILPNGDFFELDILVFINENVYWIECKSGNFQQHIQKYTNFAKKYNFSMDNSFLLLSEVDDERCGNLHALYSIRITNPASFYSQFKQKIVEDFKLLLNR